MMNDKIKELIQQVGTDVSGKWMSTENVEQLALLVINECCKCARYIDAVDIKQHFDINK